MPITSSISLDTSGFMEGIQRIQQVVRGDSISGPMEQKMSTLRKTLIAGATAFAAAVQRTYAAIGAGSELAKISRESGIAVGELMTLRQAMQTVGGSADDAQAAVNKLRGAVVAAGSGAGAAQTDLASIGLTADQFTGLTMEQGIRKVANALRTLRDPVEQNRISLALLGKDAESMVDAFATGGHIEGVAKAMGAQANVMQQSAGIFREVQKAFTQGLGFFDALKLRIQGFFVGIASEVAPQILTILNTLKTAGGGDIFDLTKIGQRVGQFGALVIASIRAGRFNEFIAASLQLGFADALEFLRAKYEEVTGYISQKLDDSGIGQKIASIVSRIRAETEFMVNQLSKLPTFIAPLVDALKGAALTFQGIIERGIGNVLLKLQAGLSGTGIIGDTIAAKIGQAGVKLLQSGIESGKAGESGWREAERLIGEAGNTLKSSVTGFADIVFGKGAIQGAATATGIPAGQTYSELKAKLEADRAALLGQIMPTGSATFGAPAGAALASGISRAQQVFGMFGSLGAGTVRGSFQTLDPMVSQQKQTNALLRQVAVNTSKAPTVAAPAYQA